MTRDQILDCLRNHGLEIRQRFGVSELAVFGSVARGQAGTGSDLDILVAFNNTPDFDRFMGLKFYLEALLGLSVDLVTTKALRPAWRQTVQREAVRVA